ncbi:MAG: citramalate synthase [Armatimonadota bacterium]
MGSSDIKLYDTTLRDGSQGEGISYTVADKLRIANELDKLGIHFIEGGWPGSNPKDMEFFLKISKMGLKYSKPVAFGSTRRAGIKACEDKNLNDLLKAKVKYATIFGKTWDLHVKDVLRTTLEENLRMIEDSVRFLTSNGLTVFYDAEHFFDGYIANKKYSIDCLKTAQKAGAEYLVLCETNGGVLTSKLTKIISEVKPHIKARLGIHCHNDIGLGIANSIAGIEAGCSMVQGTINGYGERCGNADLIPIIASLKLKLGIDCIPDENLKQLTRVSRFVSEISNISPRHEQPYTGQSAFAHKAGVHINAVLKNSHAYEHVEPSLVGNSRRILVSELGGKTEILFHAKAMGFEIDKEDKKTKKLLKTVQELEHKGYYFEAAEASFDLLLKKTIKKYNKFLELESFRIIVEKKAGKKTITGVVLNIEVKGTKKKISIKSKGIVTALDSALKKILCKFYPAVKKIHLSDFKIRVLDEKKGTASKVRVLLQSKDDKDTWSTVGVSENLIEAGLQAITDSIEYKLVKDSDNKNSIEERI